MNQIIRILSLVFRFKKGNFRYKIAYLRTNYDGYNISTGDLIDNLIYQYFSAKGPAQIQREYSATYNPSADLSRFLYTFKSHNIPLVISAHIDFSSMTVFELDEIKQSNKIFPNQNVQITLFYRETLNENHEYWIYLPTDVRIAVDHNQYLQLAATIPSL